MRVVNPNGAVGPSDTNTHTRSDIDLKRMSNRLVEPVRAMRGIRKDCEADARKLWLGEPSLDFDSGRLHVSAPCRPLDHAIMEQWMRAKQTRAGASVASAGPHR